MMKYLKFLVAFLLFVSGTLALAADLNGYTARYECRAGGPNCNVDVAALGNRTCDQIVSASTPWSSIDWSNNTICIEAGDHTGKGRLAIPSSANGTAGNYKVLRYTGDNNDDPWKQSRANQAAIDGLTVNAEYWIIHRLRSTGLVSISNKSNNIFNRILVEDFNGDLFDLGGNNHNNTLQNSVIRNTAMSGTSDKHCVMSIDNDTTPGHRVVNNEIYNCQGDGVQRLQTGLPTYDFVIENNDFYVDSSRYTHSGTQSCTENGIDLKHGGTSASPVKIIHNRFWGFRATDSSCADGSAGEAIIFHEPNGASDHNSYGLIQNNIVMDGSLAISNPNREAGGPDHWSIVGNLIYDFSGLGSGTYAMEVSSIFTEIYLNTAIKTTQGASLGWLLYSKNGNQDIRCNVAIDGVSTAAFGTGSSTQIDGNSYYNTTSAEETNKITNSLNTRADSTTYGLNAILRTAAVTSCTTGAESACFLYKVTQEGTSAGSAPSYCTSLGCPVTDDSVRLKAIRGPYTFYRKLRTAPELYTIPYARAYANTANPSESAPEANACPSSYASRPGIGISDAQ